MKAILSGQNPDELNFFSNPPESKPTLQDESSQNAVVPYKKIPVIANKHN